MASIRFIVTDSATDPARLDTEQVYSLDGDVIISDYKEPKTFNRTQAFAMDMKSSQGTKISKSRAFSMTITCLIDEYKSLEELIDSLADYQLAEFIAADIPLVGESRFFKMTGNSYEPDKIGCDYVSANLTGVYF